MDSLKNLYNKVFNNDQNNILDLPKKLDDIPKIVKECVGPTYKLEKLQFAAQERMKFLNKENEIYINREKNNYKEHDEVAKKLEVLKEKKSFSEENQALKLNQRAEMSRNLEENQFSIEEIQRQMLFIGNEEKNLEVNQNTYKNEIEENIRSYEEAKKNVSLIEANIQKLSQVTLENENKAAKIEAEKQQAILALGQSQQKKTFAEQKITEIREDLKNLQSEKKQLEQIIEQNEGKVSDENNKKLTEQRKMNYNDGLIEQAKVDNEGKQTEMNNLETQIQEEENILETLEDSTVTVKDGKNKSHVETISREEERKAKKEKIAKLRDRFNNLKLIFDSNVQIMSNLRKENYESATLIQIAENNIKLSNEMLKKKNSEHNEIQNEISKNDNEFKNVKKELADYILQINSSSNLIQILSGNANQIERNIKEYNNLKNQEIAKGNQSKENFKILSEKSENLYKVLDDIKMQKNSLDKKLKDINIQSENFKQKKEKLEFEANLNEKRMGNIENNLNYNNQYKQILENEGNGIFNTHQQIQSNYNAYKQFLPAFQQGLNMRPDYNSRSAFNQAGMNMNN